MTSRQIDKKYETFEIVYSYKDVEISSRVVEAYRWGNNFAGVKRDAIEHLKGALEQARGEDIVLTIWGMESRNVTTPDNDAKGFPPEWVNVRVESLFTL